MSSGVADAYANVVWIGGAPCVGKTTLSRLLAGKYGLDLYDLDWHEIHDFPARPGGLPAGWASLSMDERWLLPSPREMAERDMRNWSARFGLALEDVGGVERPTVAEGKIFPWSLAGVIRSPRQAIFLVPTREWRREALERRERAGMGHRFVAATSDPERARRNVAERDAILAEWIETSCRELGLRCERLDGSLDLDDSLALVEEHFRPHLPATRNP